MITFSLKPAGANKRHTTLLPVLQAMRRRSFSPGDLFCVLSKRPIFRASTLLQRLLAAEAARQHGGGDVGRRWCVAHRDFLLLGSSLCVVGVWGWVRFRRRPTTVSFAQRSTSTSTSTAHSAGQHSTQHALSPSPCAASSSTPAGGARGRRARRTWARASARTRSAASLLFFVFFFVCVR